SLSTFQPFPAHTDRYDEPTAWTRTKASIRVIRAAAVEFREHLALGRWAGEGIVGWRYDAGTLTHDLGQGVDLQRFVQHGVGELGIDRFFAARIADDDDERRRLGTLAAEALQESARFVAGEVHVDEQQRIVAAHYFTESTFTVQSGVDRQRLMA